MAALKKNIDKLIKPGTLWLYQDQEERASFLNGCAVNGLRKVNGHLNKPTNAVIVLDHKIIQETIAENHHGSTGLKYYHIEEFINEEG